MVEHLPSKHEALSLSPSTATKDSSMGDRNTQATHLYKEEQPIKTLLFSKRRKDPLCAKKCFCAPIGTSPVNGLTGARADLQRDPEATGDGCN
jgi:hypothetical protein